LPQSLGGGKGPGPHLAVDLDRERLGGSRSQARRGQRGKLRGGVVRDGDTQPSAQRPDQPETCCSDVFGDSQAAANA
jgi:hypothetical protein